MPTKEDILKVVASHVQNDELTAVIGATDESVEMTEEGFEKFKTDISGMMTFESAVNNPKVLDTLAKKVQSEADSKIHNEVKFKLLSKTEQQITDMGKEIGLNLEGMKLEDQINTIKSSKELFQSKNVDETIKQQLEDLNNQVKTEKGNNEKLKEEFKTKLNNIEIDHKLRSHLDSIELAKPYKDPVVKEGIYTSAINKVKAVAGFKIGPNKELIIHSKDNPEMDFFMGNDKIETADKLLVPHLQPYIQATDPERKPPQDQVIKAPANGVNTSASMLKNAQPI